MKKVYKLISIIALFFILIAIQKLSTDILVRQFRLIILIIIAVESIFLFKQFNAFFNKKKWLSNLSASLFSTYFFFLILESVFMFIPRSHGAAFSYSGQLWFEKYWNPINSFGYRDEQPDTTNNSNPIFFVGDSYTAGHGIKNVEDRFSNVFKSKLEKGNYSANVINLGKINLNTTEEFEEMSNFIETTNIKPKKIILQYYVNDVYHIAKKHGFEWAYDPYGKLNSIFRKAVKGSYLVNYFFWLAPHIGSGEFLSKIEGMYNDKLILKEHLNEIQRFIDYANENKIELLIVIFPLMQRLEESKAIYINKFANYLTNQNVNFIDVAELIDHLPIEQRIINNNDSHASVEVNRILAEEIYKKIN